MTGASGGTVTLVLTDIVASTERWDRDPTGMQSALGGMSSDIRAMAHKITHAKLLF